MSKLWLVSLGFVVACGKSSPPSPTAAAETAKRVETPAGTKASEVAAVAPAVAVASDKCGDGKITVVTGSDSAGTESVVFCQNDGVPAIKVTASNVKADGTPAVKTISLAQWNQIWALAEKQNWKTAKEPCVDNEAGDRMMEGLKIFQAGKKLELDCDGSVPVAWNDLKTAIYEAGPKGAMPPADEP